MATTAVPQAGVKKSHEEIARKKKRENTFPRTAGFSSLLSLIQIKQVCIESMGVCLHQLFIVGFQKIQLSQREGKNKQLSSVTHLHFKYTLNWLFLN